VLDDAARAGDGKDEEAAGFLPAPDPVAHSPEPGFGNEAGDGVVTDAGDGGPAKAKAPVPVDEKKSLESTLQVVDVQNLTRCYTGAISMTDQNAKYGSVSQQDKMQAAHACAVLFKGGEMSAKAMKILTQTVTTYRATYGGFEMQNTVTMPNVRRVLQIAAKDSKGAAAGGKKKSEGAAAGGKKKSRGAAPRGAKSTSTGRKPSVPKPQNPFKSTSEEGDVLAEYYSQWVLYVLARIPEMNQGQGMDAAMQLPELQKGRATLWKELVAQYQEATGKSFTDNKYRPLQYLNLQMMNPELFASSMLSLAEQVNKGEIPHNNVGVKQLMIKPVNLRCIIQDIAKTAAFLRAKKEAHPEDTAWATLSDMIELYLWQLGGIQTGRLLSDPVRKKGQAQELNTRRTVAGHPDRCKQLLENYNKTLKLGVKPEEIDDCANKWVLMVGLFEWAVAQIRGSTYKGTVTLDSFKKEWPEGMVVALDAVDINENQGAAGGAEIQVGPEVSGAAGGNAEMHVALDVPEAHEAAGAADADAEMQVVLEAQPLRRNPRRTVTFGGLARTVIETPKRHLADEQDLSNYDELNEKDHQDLSAAAPKPSTKKRKEPAPEQSESSASEKKRRVQRSD